MPHRHAEPTKPRRLVQAVLAVLAAHGLALWMWSGAPAPRQTTLQPPGAATPPQVRTVTDRVPQQAPTPDAEAAPASPPRPAPSEQAAKYVEPKKAVSLTQKASNATENRDSATTEPVIERSPPPQAVAIAPQAAEQATAPGSASATPFSPTDSVTLRYEVTAQRKGLSVQADATLEVLVTPPQYNARLTLKAWMAGSRIQTSRGTVDPAWGFQPDRFGDKNRSKPEQAVHFDRSRQPPVIRFSANAPDAEWLPGTQDRLSVLLQLAALLEGRAHQTPPRPPGVGETVRIHTAGTDGVEWWTFRVQGKTTLGLPAGPTEAWHLRRDPTHAYDNQVELWLAPSLGHLPVRIWWQQANGDVVDQRLATLTRP